MRKIVATMYQDMRKIYSDLNVEEKDVVTYALKVARQVASGISYVSYVAHVAFQTIKRKS